MEKKVIGKKQKAKNEAKKRVAPVQPASPVKGEILAVLKLGGSQHLIQEGTEIEVGRVPFKEEKVEVFVLRPKMGQGIAQLKMLEEKKGPKVVIMKYKAKSRYRRKTGFRASLSRVRVEKIEVK